MSSRDLKIGIVGGVVSGLMLTLFIQPILKFVWYTVMAVGGHLHKGYVDGIYRAAGANDVNIMGYALASLLILFVLPAAFYPVLTQWADMDNQGGILSRLDRGMKTFAKGLFIAQGIFLLLICTIAFSLYTGTEEIRSSFTQRLTILSPEISDTEYKTFEARWASMRGKADYDALVASMNNRAAELGIKLPPQRYP